MTFESGSSDFRYVIKLKLCRREIIHVTDIGVRRHACTQSNASIRFRARFCRCASSPTTTTTTSDIVRRVRRRSTDRITSYLYRSRANLSAGRLRNRSIGAIAAAVDRSSARPDRTADGRSVCAFVCAGESGFQSIRQIGSDNTSAHA